jgi:hypothetical protein
VAGTRIRPLAEGLPPFAVAALAALVLVAILYTVASREPKEPRGYAEFTMFPRGCLIAAERRLNVERCVVLSRGSYRLHFTKSLEGATAIAVRGSCCPGAIGASVDPQTNRSVTVAIRRNFRRPVRAAVLVP